MHPALNKNLFFIKEHVRMLKAANAYDIYDPTTGDIVLHCREQQLGFWTKLFRFTDYKRMTPFNLEVQTPEGQRLLTVRRGFTWWVSKVDVLDENDVVIGRFKQKFFSIGGKFSVHDASDKQLCMLIGHWASWDFKFATSDGIEFAAVHKKWSGLGKELFTTADNYMLNISEDVPKKHPLRLLILAAVMCIDLVLKE